MRVLCCESCSSGQRLAAPTELEKKVTKGRGAPEDAGNVQNSRVFPNGTRQCVGPGGDIVDLLPRCVQVLELRLCPKSLTAHRLTFISMCLRM